MTLRGVPFSVLRATAHIHPSSATARARAAPADPEDSLVFFSPPARPGRRLLSFNGPTERYSPTTSISLSLKIVTIAKSVHGEIFVVVPQFLKSRLQARSPPRNERRE